MSEQDGYPTPDLILQTGMGFMASKQLLAAVQIGLFEQLAEQPATADELAQRTDTPLRTTRIAADAMASLGLLEKRDGAYRNSPVADAFLSGRTPGDLRPLMSLLAQEYEQWRTYEEVVRTGDPSRAGGARADTETYDAAMEAMSGGPAQALTAVYDFASHERLLDLGGGTGAYLTSALAANPGLSGTLLEQPQTAALARRRLAEHPEGQRIEVIEGDFFTDPIPGGHDAILMANVVHNFPPERVPELLGRVRHAAAESARLLLVDFWGNVERTEPVAATLLSGQLFMEGGGEVYSVEHGRGWLEATGWRPVEHRPVAGPMSVLVAETVN